MPHDSGDVVVHELLRGLYADTRIALVVLRLDHEFHGLASDRRMPGIRFVHSHPHAVLDILAVSGAATGQRCRHADLHHVLLCAGRTGNEKARHCSRECGTTSAKTANHKSNSRDIDDLYETHFDDRQRCQRV